jgi:2,4-dienoyl-CoA reductase (NADPH2)
MAQDRRLEKLLEPGYIGKVKTRNRMIKSAAGTGYLMEDQTRPSQHALDYYEAIARGGVGILFVESPRFNDQKLPFMLRFDRDEFIPRMIPLVEVIHKHGCPTFLQLYDYGPIRFMGNPVAASEVFAPSPLDMHNERPHALTLPEVKQMIDDFANAAVRAQKAGFDGVEINAACSHLFNSFISRFWNKRDDAYGRQGIENRTRLLVEVIQEIKARSGADFPIEVLMNGIETNLLEPGKNDECLTTEETRQVAKIIEQAGADAIQVRAHTIGEHMAGFFPDLLFYPDKHRWDGMLPSEYDVSHHGAGALVPLAAMIKKEVSIPVLTVSRLDPVMGEKILQQGKADFIVMNRRLMADPELPNKVAAGRLQDIAPCTGCFGCFTPMQLMRCRMNASNGTGIGYTIERAEQKKRVAVVGGGPAGLEAARVAALRGHEVSLYEKGKRLGGLVPMAAVVKSTYLEDLPSFVRYFERQLHRLGVKVRLGQEMTAASLEQTKPDAVIVAAGGKSVLPDIPGIDSKKVVSRSDLQRTLQFFLRFLSPAVLGWLTRLWMPVGKKVVIIGGDIQGCQLAEYLLERGREVTIIEEKPELGKNLTMITHLRLLPWLQARGVRMLNGSRVESITDKGVVIITKDGSREVIPADTVIPALELVPDLSLVESLKGKVPEVYAIGDCREPKLIIDAVGEGSAVARTI